MEPLEYYSALPTLVRIAVPVLIILFIISITKRLMKVAFFIAGILILLALVLPFLW